MYSGLRDASGMSCYAAFIFSRWNENKTVRTIDQVLLFLELLCYRYPWCVIEARFETMRPTSQREDNPIMTFAV
jgi:hypothetical protein